MADNNSDNKCESEKNNDNKFGISSNSKNSRKEKAEKGYVKNEKSEVPQKIERLSFTCTDSSLATDRDLLNVRGYDEKKMAESATDLMFSELPGVKLERKILEKQNTAKKQSSFIYSSIIETEKKNTNNAIKKKHSKSNMESKTQTTRKGTNLKRHSKTKKTNVGETGLYAYEAKQSKELPSVPESIRENTDLDYTFTYDPDVQKCHHYLTGTDWGETKETHEEEQTECLQDEPTRTEQIVDNEALRKFIASMHGKTIVKKGERVYIPRYKGSSEEHDKTKSISKREYASSKRKRKQTDMEPVDPIIWPDQPQWEERRQWSDQEPWDKRMHWNTVLQKKNTDSRKADKEPPHKKTNYDICANMEVKNIYNIGNIMNTNFDAVENQKTVAYMDNINEKKGNSSNGSMNNAKFLWDNSIPNNTFKHLDNTQCMNINWNMKHMDKHSEETSDILLTALLNAFNEESNKTQLINMLHQHYKNRLAQENNIKENTVKQCESSNFLNEHTIYSNTLSSNNDNGRNDIMSSTNINGENQFNSFQKNCNLLNKLQSIVTKLNDRNFMFENMNGTNMFQRNTITDAMANVKCAIERDILSSALLNAGVQNSSFTKTADSQNRIFSADVVEIFMHYYLEFYRKCLLEKEKCDVETYIKELQENPLAQFFLSNKEALNFIENRKFTDDFNEQLKRIASASVQREKETKKAVLENILDKLNILTGQTPYFYDQFNELGNPSVVPKETSCTCCIENSAISQKQGNRSRNYSLANVNVSAENDDSGTNISDDISTSVNVNTEEMMALLKNENLQTILNKLIKYVNAKETTQLQETDNSSATSDKEETIQQLISNVVNTGRVSTLNKSQGSRLFNLGCTVEGNEHICRQNSLLQPTTDSREITGEANFLTNQISETTNSVTHHDSVRISTGDNDNNIITTTNNNNATNNNANNNNVNNNNANNSNITNNNTNNNNNNNIINNNINNDINNNNNYNNNTDMSNLKNHLLNTWFLQYCNYLKLTNQVIPRNLNSLILEEKEKNASYSYTNADDVDIRGEVVPFLRESAESVDDTNTFQNQQEFRNTIPYQSITKTHGFDEQIKKSLQLYDKKPEEKNHLMQIATQNSTSAQPRNDDYEMDINVFIQILKRKVEDMKGNEVDHKVPFQQRPIHTSVQKDKTSMNLMIEPQKMYHPSVPSFNVDGWVSNTQNQQTHEKDHQRVLPNTYERHSSMERIGNVLTTQRDSRNVCNVETNRYSNRKKNKTENPIRKTTSRKNANGRVNKKDGRDGNDGTIKEGEKGNAVYEIEATKHMNKSSQ